jgi:hypothetical protein
MTARKDCIVDILAAAGEGATREDAQKIVMTSTARPGSAPAWATAKFESYARDTKL